jgi:nicotinamidase-related amidase
MDMNKIALLIIDVQVGSFVGQKPAYGGRDFLERVRSLIHRCREKGIVVVYIQHCGGPGDPDEPGTAGWPIHPLIGPGEDAVVQKRQPDAFQDTPLQTILKEKGIKKIIIAGLQTEYCVDTTTRRAFSLGYEVVLVGDCHTSWDSKSLGAVDKIAYHNQVLGNWFATMKMSDEF